MSKNKKTGKVVSNKSSASAIDAKNSSVFYRVLWYIIVFVIIIVFIKQLKNNKTVDKNEIKLSLATLSTGVYQEFLENKLLKKPFITDLKAVKNKYEFRFLKKVNLDGFYVGKKNYIFGEGLIKAYFGDDYHGDSIIKKQVKKAKFVQDSLKALGIELLILFAPGKSSIHPELLPKYVLKTEKKTSNYETYVNECKSQQVNFLDFIQIFNTLKTKTKYPLFPKYGSHWSYYAECIVIDSTIKQLEKLMRVNLPDIKYTDIQLKDTAMVRDADIFRKTQMDVPKGDTLAYPQSIVFEQGEGIKPQKIIAIGDSYFRGFLYLGAMEYAFDNSQQWYYNNSLIPEKEGNPEVWELDLKAEILKSKAVVILCNEANLANLGNGFIDEAYELFHDSRKYYAVKKEKNKINTYKKEIRNNKETLAQLTKDAHQRGIVLDTLITQAALKLVRENKK